MSIFNTLVLAALLLSIYNVLSRVATALEIFVAIYAKRNAVLKKEETTNEVHF